MFLLIPTNLKMVGQILLFQINRRVAFNQRLQWMRLRRTIEPFTSGIRGRYLLLVFMGNQEAAIAAESGGREAYTVVDWLGMGKVKRVRWCAGLHPSLPVCRSSGALKRW
jgi:hypothetical protein